MKIQIDHSRKGFQILVTAITQYCDTHNIEGIKPFLGKDGVLDASMIIEGHEMDLGYILEYIEECYERQVVIAAGKLLNERFASISDKIYETSVIVNNLCDEIANRVEEEIKE